ncbi:MAG: GNAT family N-acetyltransferase [Hyphomicrobiales bacterium]|nr:GNAT family N-acetyltransferase [Hyphomicrobiales bacterium]
MTQRLSARLVRAAEISAKAWDACANPAGAPWHPFVAHAFFHACEESGSAAAATGWEPRHIALEEAGELVALMPLYVKSHSQGEYVFDHGWADAFMRAGGNYYPKLLCAVPFTPVAGPRFLVRAGEDAAQRRRQLLAAAVDVAEQLDLSSLHLNFLREADWRACGEFGFLRRTDQQFYWHNQNYERFEDFLAALSSRKRKTIRKERQKQEGLAIDWLTGDAIRTEHWDAFFAFYQDTGARKWGRPYLNRAFFDQLAASMGERLLLVLASADGAPIAGALHVIGGDTLYGRYWGCVESHAFLHFELCYYQAMDYAIAHKLKHVEAGAQGPHKLLRGYLPAATYSAHYIRHAGLQRAVADYLDMERREVRQQISHLSRYSPFRKTA